MIFKKREIKPQLLKKFKKAFRKMISLQLIKFLKIKKIIGKNPVKGIDMIMKKIMKKMIKIMILMINNKMMMMKIIK